jgi:hypothetical protein
LILCNADGEHLGWCEVPVKQLTSFGGNMVLPSRRKRMLNQKLPLFFFNFNRDLTKVEITTAEFVKKFGVDFTTRKCGTNILVPRAYRVIFSTGDLLN